MEREWRADEESHCDENLWVDGRYVGMICKDDPARIQIAWDAGKNNIAPTVERAKRFLECVAAQDLLLDEYRNSFGDIEP